MAHYTIDFEKGIIYPTNNPIENVRLTNTEFYSEGEVLPIDEILDIMEDRGDKVTFTGTATEQELEFLLDGYPRKRFSYPVETLNHLSGWNFDIGEGGFEEDDTICISIEESGRVTWSSENMEEIGEEVEDPEQVIFQVFQLETE